MLRVLALGASWPLGNRSRESRVSFDPLVVSFRSDWPQARPRMLPWALFLVKPEEKVSSPDPASSSPRCRQMLRPLPLRVGQGHTCLPLTLLSALSYSGDSALCPLPGGVGRESPPPLPRAAEIHCQRFHRDTKQIVVITPHSEKPHHCSMTFAPSIAKAIPSQRRVSDPTGNSWKGWTSDDH